jgi:hypothetical protein
METAEIEMPDTIYRWRHRPDLDNEKLPDDSRERGTLAEALEDAERYDTDIDLFDEAGSRKGWVFADGTYKFE